MIEYSPPPVKPHYRRNIKVFALLLGMAVFILLFPYIKDLVVVVIAAVIFAYVLKPGMRQLMRLGLSRTTAILSHFLALALLVALIGQFFLPFFVDEAGRMNQSIKRLDLEYTYEQVLLWLDEQAPGVSASLGMESGGLYKLTLKLKAYGWNFLQRSAKYARSAINVLVMMVVVLFLAFFFLRDAPWVTRRLIESVPNRYFEMTMSLLYRIDQQLGNYILCIIIESAIVGFLTWILFAIMGLKFALLLGLLHGILNMIPYFGPMMAYIPISLMVILTYDPPGLGLFWMAVILISVQIIDNWILKLVLISWAVKVHPAVVLLVVMIGGKLAGPLGMFIAIPVYTVLQVIVVDFYSHLKKYRIV